MDEVAKSNQSYLSDDMHKRDEEMMAALKTMAKALENGNSLSPMDIRGLEGNVWDMIGWMDRKQTLKTNLRNHLLKRKDKDKDKDED